MRTLGTVGRQLLSLGVSLLIASFIVFALINALPGDVAGTILGPDSDPASIAALRERMGLDRPLLLRYVEWLGGLLTGNPGRSALSGVPIGSVIGQKLAVTAWLAVLSMLAAVVLAVPTGLYSAVRRKRVDGVLISGLTQLAMAVPHFLVGLILMLVFAVTLRWLPANGYTPLTRDPLQWLRHLVLPVAAIAVVEAAMLIRYVRSAFINVLNEDHFRTARAVGWRFVPAVIRHGLRNASLEVITVAGLQLASLFVGSIVVENVFLLPGLGSQLLTSVNQRDLPVVQAIVMLFVAIVLVINTAVDICHRLLDPRVRTRDEETAGS
ncbi:ABC transporter permease [Propionibacterium australiense]|uniref:ABC transporter permease subunit n=1 Tax=Propionibacterium australiense TaxID=119981 RepID=A0A383S2Z7_9ACTN|nr:ABC transporter permease [Propionibacterium australiense]RLP11674.1 ABC transporter permease subunit [Propionibacterium australiense]RLP12187.1 ABC transporter permease subunit [Propionibacterium australiense]SYZ32408.1 Binding-protein-dependent transport system inner membrane component [Propionibacterium australiense]VEH90274.1 Glutathione transport system permease protein gsiC [Propionibacterium australiense]